MSGISSRGSAQLRVPVLIALILGTCLGLVHFYGSGYFVPFFFYSLLGNAATVALLWAEQAQRFGTNRTYIALYLLILTPSDSSWRKSSRTELIVSVVWVAIVCAMIVAVAVAPTRGAAHAAKSAADDSEKGFPDSYSPLIDLVLSLVVSEKAASFLTHQEISIVWSFPFLPQLILFFSAYISYRIALKKINPTNNLSIVNRND